MRNYVMDRVGYMYTCGIGHQCRYIHRIYVIVICVIITLLRSIYHTYMIYHESEYLMTVLLYAQLLNAWGGIYVYMWYRAPMPLYLSDICDCDMYVH